MHGLHFGEDTSLISLDPIKKGATWMSAVRILIGHGASRSLRIPFFA